MSPEDTGLTLLEFSVPGEDGWDVSATCGVFSSPEKVADAIRQIQARYDTPERLEEFKAYQTVQKQLLETKKQLVRELAAKKAKEQLTSVEKHLLRALSRQVNCLINDSRFLTPETEYGEWARREWGRPRMCDFRTSPYCIEVDKIVL